MQPSSFFPFAHCPHTVLPQQQLPEFGLNIHTPLSKIDPFLGQTTAAAAVVLYIHIEVVENSPELTG